MRRLTIALLTVAPVVLAPGARADTITIANTTDNVAYLTGANGGPYNFYDDGTSSVGPGGVGSEFDTSKLAITTTQLTGGNYAVDLQYTTLFSGSETVGNASVYYPDIFLRSSASGYSNAGFNYAISLGDEGSNGGVAAGFYSVSSYLTSKQVWAGRPGFIYTGQYTSTDAYQPGQAGFAAYDAPTVLTGGTLLGSSDMTSTQQSDGSYVMDVQLTLTPAEAAVFDNGYDIYWGTGDCSNGSFLATVGDPSTPVPEPATLAVLTAGLLAVGWMKARPGALPLDPVTRQRASHNGT